MGMITTKHRAAFCATLTVHTPYSFSFITGALLAREATVFAGLLAEGQKWTEAEALVAEQNLLQMRKSSSRVRLVREIRHRMSTLNSEEIRFLASAPVREQTLLLFLAVCRHYEFVRDFVVEVLSTKVAALDRQIALSDYSRFVDGKAALHPEILALSDSSVAKIRQVLFRMLHEAGLIDSTRTLRITPPAPSRALVRLIDQTDPKQLNWLLLTELEIKAAL